MNRRSFYAEVRNSLFADHLAESQVAGMEALIDAFEQRAGFDQRWFAYILATTFHETARTMQPIREFGRGRGRPYGTPDPVTGKVYYGRGFVQLTHKANYKKMGEKLHIDLVGDPDLALHLDVATSIIFEGMVAGDFTGKKLADYFTTAASDWFHARQIVNRLDCAAMIEGYGKKFYSAVLVATDASLADRTSDPMPDPESGGVRASSPRSVSALDEEKALLIAESLAAHRQ